MLRVLKESNIVWKAFTCSEVLDKTENVKAFRRSFFVVLLLHRKTRGMDETHW